jgi:two-component system OmpR family response regulator
MKEVKSIFIVDDDQMQRDMLSDYLGKYKKISIRVFETGQDCLKNISPETDIVFLDYNFDSKEKNPMNGIDILKEIKKKSPETEVIMLSGQDKIEIAVNTMKFGAFDYIVKSESAFHRADNVIYNLIRKFKLESAAKLYKRLFIIFAIAFVFMLIIIVILYRMKMINDQPSWF